MGIIRRALSLLLILPQIGCSALIGEKLPTDGLIAVTDEARGIVLGATAQKEASVNPSDTYTITVTDGSGRLLVVHVCSNLAAETPVVTANTVAMTQSDDSGASATGRCFTFHQVAPAIGVNTISLSFTGAVIYSSTAYYLKNVNQASPIDSHNGAHNDSGDPAEVAVTVVTAGTFITDHEWNANVSCAENTTPTHTALLYTNSLGARHVCAGYQNAGRVLPGTYTDSYDLAAAAAYNITAVAWRAK